MNDSASDGMDQGNGPEVAASSLSARKKTIYSVVLVAGLIAAVWIGYRALVPADCGCTRDRKSPPRSQPGGPLVADFRVAALAYRGRSGVVDAIQAHAASLRSADYAFVTLSQVASAVRSGERLPKRTVAITLDTESKAIANDLLAFMRMSGIPVSLAVRPHLVGKPGTIGWDTVSELQSAGAELHAAVDAGRGEADLLADLRRFAKRLSPARIHVVSLDTRSNALTARLGSRTGMLTAWRIGSSRAVPMGEPEETSRDRPKVRLLELDRIPVGLSETPATLVADVNKLTGQPDPEQVAAKHAGAGSNGQDDSSQAKPEDKETGATK